MIISRTLLITVVLLIAACSGGDRQESMQSDAGVETRSALVVTSNYPLYYFAIRITQGVDFALEVVLPDIEGDPAFWIPSAEQVQVLQSADRVILNGAGAESWLNLISLNKRRLVDTSIRIAK